MNQTDALEVKFLLDQGIFVEEVAKRLGYINVKSMQNLLNRHGYTDLGTRVRKALGNHLMALETLDPGVRKANAEKATISYGWIPACTVRENA